jgi:catechol 2,3-dioxygenase-like lactoylglutathione lyase family enzyme
VTRALAASAVLIAALPHLSQAQIAAPNSMGVAMGHLHFHVRDVDANRRFFVLLGGSPARVGAADIVRFPDILVFLTQGSPSGTSDGSVVNHVAFRVPAFSALEAKGVTVTRLEQFPGVGYTLSPEGERVELFEDSATNLGFTLDSGGRDANAERHNRKMTMPIAPHHIHLYLPAGAEAEAKAWYARTFGGVPGKRWRYEAVDLPGINLNFSAAQGPTAPTRGRMLDHIGFEIANLEGFCRALEARGVKFDAPYTKQADGVATARLTDPWGTSIELTEGLR